MSFIYLPDEIIAKYILPHLPAPSRSICSQVNKQWHRCVWLYRQENAVMRIFKHHHNSDIGRIKQYCRTVQADASSLYTLASDIAQYVRHLSVINCQNYRQNATVAMLGYEHIHTLELNGRVLPWYAFMCLPLRCLHLGPELCSWDSVYILLWSYRNDLTEFIWRSIKADNSSGQRSRFYHLGFPEMRKFGVYDVGLTLQPDHIIKFMPKLEQTINFHFSNHATADFLSILNDNRYAQILRLRTFTREPAVLCEILLTGNGAADEALCAYRECSSALWPTANMYNLLWPDHNACWLLSHYFAVELNEAQKNTLLVNLILLLDGNVPVSPAFSRQMLWLRSQGCRWPTEDELSNCSTALKIHVHRLMVSHRQ